MDREDVRYIYIEREEYYSAIKENEILPFAKTWMDLEGIMLSEISHTEKDKYCMIPLICGILKKANAYNRRKQTHRYREQASGYQWGEGSRGGKIGVGD